MALALQPPTLITLGLPSLNPNMLHGHPMEIAKRVTFFRNGDGHFAGRRYLISDRRYRTWEALLTELSHQIGPAAVQQVYELPTKCLVTSFAQISDGHSYVCAGHERFNDLEYESISRKLAVLRKKKEIKDDTKSEVGDAQSKDGLAVRRRPARALNTTVDDEVRVFTVLRNGDSSNRGAKLAMPRRMVQNWEQFVRLVEDVAPVVGGVRKIFAADGRQIVDVNQLFSSDGPKEIIVVGTDKFDRQRWTTYAAQRSPLRLPPIDERPRDDFRGPSPILLVPLVVSTASVSASASPKAGAQPPRAGLRPRVLSPAPGAPSPATKLPASSPLPPIPASPLAAAHGHAARASSPELDTNTEFVPTDEPNPNLVENFLIQSLAPAVRASQERERQQRGYRMKLHVRAKNRLDDGVALVQQQETAHAHLVDKIENERRRQLSVFESKRAQLNVAPRTRELQLARLHLGAAVRIFHWLARCRIARRKNRVSKAANHPAAHPRASLSPAPVRRVASPAARPLPTPAPVARPAPSPTRKVQPKQEQKPSTPPLANYHKLAQKRDITTPDLTVSRSMVAALENKAASLIQAHVRGYLARRSHPNARKAPAPAPAPASSPAVQAPAPTAVVKRAAAQQPQHSPLSVHGMVDDAFVASRYTIGDKLGDGNFAVVKRCVEKSTGKAYALKIMDKSKTKGIKEAKMVENEVAVMRSVDHPSIIKLVDVFDTPAFLYLVLELSEGGDLFDRVVSKSKYSEDDAVVLIHSLATAVHFLHSRNIIHRDLKPENLLVYQDARSRDVVKLADFGLSMVVTDPLHTVCGTPTYVAPEIIAEDPKGYGLAADMWAIGVIAYILLCGFPPFASATKNQRDLFDRIKAGRFSFPDPYWRDVSAQAKDMITQLLKVDQAERLTAVGLLRHPWLQRVADPASRAYVPRRLSARDLWFSAVKKISAVRRFPLIRSDN